MLWRKPLLELKSVLPCAQALLVVCERSLYAQPPDPILGVTGMLFPAFVMFCVVARIDSCCTRAAKQAKQYNCVQRRSSATQAATSSTWGLALIALRSSSLTCWR